MKRSINSNINTATATAAAARFTPGERKVLLALVGKIEVIEARLKIMKIEDLESQQERLNAYVAKQKELAALYERFFELHG